MVRNARFHGRGDAKGRVRPAKVVVREVQTVGRPEVAPLLAEGARQTRERRGDFTEVSRTVPGRVGGCLEDQIGIGDEVAERF